MPTINTTKSPTHPTDAKKGLPTPTSSPTRRNPSPMKQFNGLVALGFLALLGTTMFLIMSPRAGRMVTSESSSQSEAEAYNHQQISLKLKEYQLQQPSSNIVPNDDKMNSSGPVIPKIIHQTAKTYPTEADDWEMVGWLRTYKEKNPGYEYRFYNDTNIESYMRTHLSEREWMIWSNISTKIQQMDIFRYVVVYNEGGWYFDSDTYCVKGIEGWRKPEGVGFLAGIEGICPDKDITCLPRRIQLNQWAFGSKPHHPILRRLLANIFARESTMLRDRNHHLSAVEVTGPGVWTDTIFGYVAEMYGEYMGTTWNENAEMWNVGDVLLYSGKFLSPNTHALGWQYLKDENPDVYVRHIYRGSWKAPEKRGG